MTSAMMQIVVGYDGSPDSVEALDWAVREARLHATGLIVCHAWTPGPAFPGGTTDSAIRDAGEKLLEGAIHGARRGLGCAEIRPLLVAGPPARVLCELGSTAAMVVVGPRGQEGSLAGLLLGSVSLQVAAYASGPVTVVRGHWQPVASMAAAPVVVGVDGSGPAQAAVAFAFEEAARYAVPLVAVCALADTAGVLGSARQVEEDFDQALAKCEPDYPEVQVERVVHQGAPREILIEAAACAQLLVVGARGRGGLPEMRLGSVSIAVLHHAPCTVSIIRER